MKQRNLAAVLATLGLGLALVATAHADSQTQPSTEAAAPAKTDKAGKSDKAETKKVKLRAKVKGTLPVKPETAPEHIQVQHILIGFKGSVPGKDITLSKEDAGKLAHKLLQELRDGADFDEYVKKYTNDSPPGIYGMSNNGVTPAQGEYPRGGMVPAFGNVGFVLSVGNIDVAEYDAKASPYGWHIIKRIK